MVSKMIIFSFIGLVIAIFYTYSYNSTSRTSDSISPTAHYTSYIWSRNNLGDSRLQSTKGLCLYMLLEPWMILSRYFDGPTAEQQLLCRHILIDKQLEEWIETKQISQVIEVASGMSSRGLRFRQKYGDRIKYIEADLSGMHAIKSTRIGKDIDNDYHQLHIIDAMQSNTTVSDSLHAVITNSGLSRKHGVAIITEGLLNYFNKERTENMWKNFAKELITFKHGFYVTNVHLDNYEPNSPVLWFKKVLSIFVQGDVPIVMS